MHRFGEIVLKIRKFADDRDWNQFHSPKNLSMALSVEAAELLEHFQWLTEEQSRNLPPHTRNQVTEEIADVFNYLVRISDMLDIDLLAAAAKKIEINELKYPVDKSRGRATKYTEFDR